jgi:hypothetical protein
MQDEVMVVHAFYEFGELPVGEDEQRFAPELAELLNDGGLDLVQGYNDSAGYYLVEHREVNREDLKA